VEVPSRFRHPARLALDDRQALEGILYVLHTPATAALDAQEH
jgi:hypothetical protein